MPNKGQKATKKRKKLILCTKKRKNNPVGAKYDPLVKK